MFIGAIFSVWVGYTLQGLPAIIHIPLALAAGALGGALWALPPAILKAKVGAHEVINTIMMNYIAFRLSEWLLNGPMMRPGTSNPVSPIITPTAELPRFFPDPIRFHLGFFIALGVAVFIWWFLFRTTLGFELRTVGANPHAARYAGMSITRNYIIALCLSGALAGLAGANEVLGVNHNLANAFSSGYGFDSIALALLGKSHPGGRGAGRAAVWHPAKRRHAHAEYRQDPAGHHRRGPGAGDRLRGRARHYPRHLPHPRALRRRNRVHARLGEIGSHGHSGASASPGPAAQALTPAEAAELATRTRYRVLGVIMLLLGVASFWLFARGPGPGACSAPSA